MSSRKPYVRKRYWNEPGQPLINPAEYPSRSVATTGIAPMNSRDALTDHLFPEIRRTNVNGWNARAFHRQATGSH